VDGSNGNSGFDEIRQKQQHLTQKIVILILHLRKNRFFQTKAGLILYIFAKDTGLQYSSTPPLFFHYFSPATSGGTNALQQPYILQSF
jgi:hypothetical protein